MRGFFRSWMIPFTLACLAVPGAEGAPKDKQKVPVRAIIQFRQIDEGTVFFADMLDGLDYSKNPAMYTDAKAGSIKVGIFAVTEPDGTNKSMRYSEKILYPDELKRSDGTVVYCEKPEVRFLIKTLRLVRKGVYLDDLMKIYQRKLKACKNERDKELKQRQYSRLYNWCNANFLYKYADKITKELKRLEEPEAPVEADPEFDPEARNKEIAEACRALPGIGEVLVRHSRHIVIASDTLPDKTLTRLLKLGERVCKDFSVFMYDESAPAGKAVPDEEILRLFYFKRLATMEAALQNASTLSNCGNMRSRQELDRTLKMGGMNFTSMVKNRVLRTGMACEERGDPSKPNSIKESGKDHNDHMVHQLGHTLIDNRMRSNSARGSGRLVMPWLEEGMAIYLSVKHLGTKNTGCVDFPEDASRYASQGEKKKKGFDAWFGDVETMVNQIALENSADGLSDMIRIPHYSKLKPQTAAKAFSTIDFLVESDRVGFLQFIDALQKHYKVLYLGKEYHKFVKELDPIVAESFTGAAVKKGRTVVPLDSVEALEAAWRDWAQNYVLRKK